MAGRHGLPDRRLLPPPKRSRFGFAQAGPAGIMIMSRLEAGGPED
jgi:hypothetical protein